MATKTITSLFFVTALGISTNACKDRGSYDSGLKSADATTIARIKDHRAPAGQGPSDTLTADARVGVVFSQQCGVEGSSVGLFKNPLPANKEWAWFEEKKIRKWAAPAVGNKCAEGESFDTKNNYCWRPYVFQFFPVAQNSNDDHYLVSGTSPLMRVIDVKDKPSPRDSCKFSNDSGLIFITGILNPYLGESWFTTDPELLATIVAWNRSRPDLDPTLKVPFERKLTSLPGYIQVVGNANNTFGGVRGSHDERAIVTMARNIELAFKAGVRNLEIVTHSNGMITAQVALTEFSKNIKKHGSSWQNMREKRTHHKMDINLFHLQAAPSQRWAMSALDSFGNNSNFLPNAKWVQRSSFGIPYWGWEWDFSAYTALETFVNLNIEYFYNAPDYWTYPWSTSVGRFISKKWHEEVKGQGYAAGIKTTIKHHACTTNSTTACGPAHSTQDPLWDFPNPGFQNQNPMKWQTEIRSGRTVLSAESTRPQNTSMNDLGNESVQIAIQQLPDFICLDVEINRDHCKKIYNHQAGPNSISGLPGTTVCANKSDINSPCKSNTCGDGICALGENKTCSDCDIPSEVTLCKCAEGSCSETKVTCNGRICNNTNAVTVNSCICEQGDLVETCGKDDLNCLLEFTASTCLKKDIDLAADVGFNLKSEYRESRITKPEFEVKEFR